MPKKFPMFIDITGKKVLVYGAGKIASRRIQTLLLFGPSLTVCAPEASQETADAFAEGKLSLKREPYRPGSIPADTWMVLAATDDPRVNERIHAECKEKGILVNVCSDQELCDFQFPGVVAADDLVIGINAGGNDHRLAKIWTEKIRKEVEKNGDDDQAQEAAHVGEPKENGT